ncbi:hypothetical protein K501DRAFT_331683 [Backusella circina FSU 941]|nr:hypothetical protein K501DRAFT_331683 [Backusella circina FSU 941]
MSTDASLLAPASAFPPRPYEIQLKDLILGTAVGLNEWISRELKRLQENQQPRHCHDYEALMEIIEDPTRFQIHALPPGINIPPMQPAPHRDYYDDDGEDEYVDDDEEEEEYDDDDTDSINTTTTTTTTTSTNTNTTNNTNTTTATKPSSSPPLWLCKVFAELLRYCKRASKQVSAPKMLLNEFEKIRNDIKLGNTVDVRLFKEKLLTILFGKIQMPQHLVPAWKQMCEWVYTSMDEQSWLKLTLNAYTVAHKLCITEILLRHRQHLQKPHTKI